VRNLGPAGTFCEQKVLPDGSRVTLSLSGGGGYGAGSATFGDAVDGGTPIEQLPQSITITSVKVGNTEVGGNPASLAGLNGTFDKNQDITISFSCDGNATTGSGCGTLDPFDLVALAGSTSKNPRTAFTNGTEFGVVTCFEQPGAANPANRSSTFTIKAQALQTMLGTQTGGSMQLAVLRVRAAVLPGAGNIKIGGVGRGVFGLINLP
jgi:hypothetical protein